MIIGVIGSRQLRNHPQVKGIIEDFLYRYDATMVVSGGAPGVDSMAEFVARQNGMPVEIYHADWDRLGKSAGFQRNGEIAARIDHLLAIMIPGGTSGSKDTISKTMKMGKPVTIFTVEPVAPNQPVSEQLQGTAG